MRKIIKRIPAIGTLATRAYRRLFPFRGSEDYWIRRYEAGRDSGAGSYDELAEFKAEIINRFVKDNGVSSVIEYGSGDGNQLRLMQYPSYHGFDVSPRAIEICQDAFAGDPTKTFGLMSDYEDETAQLTLSLDVIFHLVEDEVFHSYMERLFESSERFVIIYSSNTDTEQVVHERHRQFTAWIEENKPGWKLIRHIPNRFPSKPKGEGGSPAEFYIYEKA